VSNYDEVIFGMVTVATPFLAPHFEIEVKYSATL